MKSFKDFLGRRWIACGECEVGYKTQCVYSAKRKPNKGFCIQGRLRKKGEE